MSPEETGKLLGVCATFDRRKVGTLDVLAWHRVLGDLPYADCENAVMAHYAEGSEWLMPAHVRQRVRAARRDRIEREVIPAPPAELTDEPKTYRASLAATVERIADGKRVIRAIAAPVESAEPTPGYLEAKENLPVKLLTPQEKARLQAEESRAERAALNPDDLPKETSQ